MAADQLAIGLFRWAAGGGAACVGVRAIVRIRPANALLGALHGRAARFYLVSRGVAGLAARGAGLTVCAGGGSAAHGLRGDGVGEDDSQNQRAALGIFGRHVEPRPVRRLNSTRPKTSSSAATPVTS
jgi:hypothetical protein